MATVIASASGKGGVGKTSFVVLLALSLIRRGQKVLLLELDCGLRGLDLLLPGESPVVYDLKDLLTGAATAEQVITPLKSGLSLISAPPDPDFIPSTGALHKALEDIGGQFDTILIDCPAGIGPAVRAAAHLADMTVMAVTPDWVSVRGAGIAAETLRREGAKELRLVINMVHRRNPIKNFDDIIDTVGARLLGVVPYYTALQKRDASDWALLYPPVFDMIAGRLAGLDLPLIID